MPTITSVSSTDLLAWMAIPEVDSKSYVRATCDEISMGHGPHPATAKCTIPFDAAEDRTAPELVADSGLIDSILIGNVLRVRGGMGNASGDTQFLGRVLEISGEIYSDIVSVVGKDPRWDLGGCPIIGSFWMSQKPAGTKEIVYRTGIRAKFNQAGFPNLIWVGGKPAFCHMNFGIVDGNIPPASDRSETQASYWDPVAMFEYYYYCFHDWVAMGQTVIAWYPACPKNISWSLDYYLAVIKIDTDHRKGKEMVIDSLSVLDCITKTCQMAGHYAPNMIPGDDTCTLTIVPTRYDDSSSKKTTLIRPSDLTNFTDLMVTNGSIIKDGHNLFSIFAAQGERIAVETRVQTIDVNTAEQMGAIGGVNKSSWLNEAEQGLLHGSLSPATTGYDSDPIIASTDRMKQFEDFVCAMLNTLCDHNDGTKTNLWSPEDAVNIAFQVFQDVARDWKLSDDFNAQLVANHRFFNNADLPWAYVGHEILPSILSRYIQNTIPDSNVFSANMSSRLPINIEFLDKSFDNDPPPYNWQTTGALPTKWNWALASKGDGLSIDHQGIISLPALRDPKLQIVLGRSWQVHASYTIGPNGEYVYASDNSDPTKFKVYLTEYRMTVAIPLDIQLNIL